MKRKGKEERLRRVENDDELEELGKFKRSIIISYRPYGKLKRMNIIRGIVERSEKEEEEGEHGELMMIKYERE